MKQKIKLEIPQSIYEYNRFNKFIYTCIEYGIAVKCDKHKYCTFTGKKDLFKKVIRKISRGNKNVYTNTNTTNSDD